MRKAPSPEKESPPNRRFIHFLFVHSGATYQELRDCYLELHEERHAWSAKEQSKLRFRLELWLHRSKKGPRKSDKEKVHLQAARVFAEYNSSLTGESLNEHEGFIQIERPVSHPQNLPKELPWLWSAILNEWQGLQEHLQDAA